jgi:lysophospholipase L1-like esterase
MSRRHRVLACLVTPTLLTLAVAAPAAAATSYSSTDYVALGDSYSSGVGAPGQRGLCLRGSSGYPAQWARRNDPASFIDLACGGATTSDVLSLQIPFLTAKADLVTITIGGNDAGFAPTVISCTVGSDAACAHVVATAHDFVTQQLPAKLVVLSYPILFDTGSANCGIGGMSLTKRRALNSGARDLDELIGARAVAAGFVFADVRGAFAGHGICGPSPWINGLTVLPPTDSFHPNANGYTYGYLPTLSRALG